MTDSGFDRTEQELRLLLHELVGRELDGLEPDTDLVDALDLDSLAALRMLAAIEKRLNVRFPDDRLSTLRTTRQLVNAIRTARTEQEPRRCASD